MHSKWPYACLQWLWMNEEKIIRDMNSCRKCVFQRILTIDVNVVLDKESLDLNVVINSNSKVRGAFDYSGDKEARF